MAETTDYIHIYDVNEDFNHCQIIDLFGEISGIDISSDDSNLFIGVQDINHGCLLDYKRIEQTGILEWI
jgi:hypothetical protein